ncbi:MAG: hypothetical protein WDZ35_12410 [Crocinitomicaceae bacterium]
MRIFSIVILSVLLAFASSSFTAATKMDGAQKGDWVKLGSRAVDMKADHDVIPVTAKEGTFTKVRLRIMKAPIHLLNMNILFRNGSSENVVFNRKFAAGSYTRIIDLKGNKRIIKSVKINYKSVPAGKGKAVIILLGKH